MLGLMVPGRGLGIDSALGSDGTRSRRRLSFDPALEHRASVLRSLVCFHGIGEVGGGIQPDHVDLVVEFVLELVARHVSAHSVAHALGRRSVGVLEGVAGGTLSGLCKEESLGRPELLVGLTLVFLGGIGGSRRVLGLAPTARRGCSDIRGLLGL